MIRLLCTDLDRTLLPNGGAPVSPGALDALRRLILREPLHVAYVTGRDLGRALEGIAQFAVPEPDFILADVGTSVHQRRGDQWTPVPEWRERLVRAWAGRSSADVHATVGDDPRLTAQEDDRQGPHKQSYYLDRAVDQTILRRDLTARLDDAGFESTLVLSDDPERGCGLLDILPTGATKHGAIEFLRNRLSLSRPQVMFAGDSGNDVDVLVSPIPGVLVANADDTVRSAATQGARAHDTQASLYLACGGLRLPDGATSNGNYSGGIVEGLLHFDPALRRHLDPE